MVPDVLELLLIKHHEEGSVKEGCFVWFGGRVRALFIFKYFIKKYETNKKKNLRERQKNSAIDSHQNYTKYTCTIIVNKLPHKILL